MNLGQMLKEKRFRRGLTLEALSQILGISAATISRVEQNKTKADFETTCAVLSWLGIPATDYFGSKPVSAVNTNTITTVCALIDGDPYIDQENKPVLKELFCRSYEVLVKYDQERNLARTATTFHS